MCSRYQVQHLYFHTDFQNILRLVYCNSINIIVESMSQTLESGDRIEVRGFGSFSLHYREARMGRNPKTGEKVQLDGKYVPHFKPGKELRERVDY